MSWFILNLAESLCLHLMEKFTSSAFHCDNGQNERCILLSQQSDPLEDFNKFDSQDTIFEEYDPPSLGDYNNMDWKRSRPTKWWISLWKAMNCVVLIQLLGGLAVGLFAIGIVVLELNSVDLCYELQHQNWTSVPKKIQNIIVTADTISVSVDCPGSEDEDDPAVEGVTGLVPVLAIEDGESSTHMSLEKEIAIIAEYKRALLSAGYDSSSASSLDSENGEKNSEFQHDFNYDHDDGNQHPEEIFFFP